MKKIYYLFILTVASASIYSVLQTDPPSVENEHQSVETALEQWDPVRGAWLAESLEAIRENRSIPDRMFPEDLTPHQMISLLPNELRNKVEHSFVNGTISQANLEPRLRIGQKPTTSRPRPLPQINPSNCATISARSYGDPHLVTFDGARYSFQTVGEFVLTRSHAGMEIQTRQSPQNEDFSFNTAVAMNVGGDRVGIYARNYPDSDHSTPLRINGRPAQIATHDRHFLPNGGIIRRTSQTDYIVDWPTGESVTADLRSQSQSSFVNVQVHVTECGSYDGLLGNANGIRRDDFGQSNHQASIYIPDGDVFSGSNEEVARNRLTYIANALGDRYRVTTSTSLFDYPAGSSTYTFTDRNFPRVHRTIEEIPEAQQEEARKVCERSGVSADDMNGCIFDQAYLEIEPAPERRKEDVTEGIILRPVERPQANVNSGPNRPTVTRKPTTTGNNNRPSVDPIIHERMPTKEVSDPDPREPTSKDSRYREEQIQYQQALEEDRKRAEREQEQLERERERQDEAEREATERREEESRRKKEEMRREEIAREKAEQEQKEQQRQLDRERQERIEREEAQRKEEERQERIEREERQRKERLEAEKKVREEEARRAKAERKRREEAQRKAREEAERKRKEDAARKAREEAEKKRREESARKVRNGR